VLTLQPYTFHRTPKCYCHTFDSNGLFAVLTGGCNGLCDPVTLVPKLHQDPNCTKADVGELPILNAWYDYSAVGCIKMVDGNVNKTECLEGHQ